MFFLLHLLALKSFAQSEVLQGLQSDYQRHVAGTVKEKMFVHTDKAFYLAGELVWFKLYNVEEATHKPAALSKVAYAELLDGENKSVVQAKIELKEGEGSGSFYLPFSLPSGVYTFRAYTRWMKNFGPAYFFEKHLTIVNTLNDEAPPATAATGAYHISFFPEGGHLVGGLPAKVGFKLTDQNGRGAVGKGIVVNSRQDTVALFETHKFGLGSFMFSPVAGEPYKAVVTLADGSSLTNPLPPAAESGFVMQVTEAGQNSLQVTVRRPAATSHNYIYLIASNRQQIKLAERGTWQNNTVVFHVAKDRLGEGITSFMLFNERRQPLSERLYFIQPAQSLRLQAQSSAPAYGSRQKASVSFSVTGNSTDTASLSMAVYRIDSVQTPDEINIVNYLWLTSELQGNVEAPEYYLTQKGPEGEQAMDNLMLTHGWRRFAWEKEVLAGNPPAFDFIPEYKGHIVTGMVRQLFDGKPAAGIPAFLSIPGRHVKLHAGESGPDGRVYFALKDFYGPGELVVQTNTSRDSAYRVELLSPFAEMYTATLRPRFTLTAGQAAHLVQNSIGTQVQYVYRFDSLSRFIAPTVDSTPFYGPAPFSYLLDDYTRFTTMEEVLREYVREINVRRRGSQYQLIVFNEPKKTFFDGNALVLLDGIPVFDQNKLFAYDPMRVQKLEVVGRRYFLGNQIFEGITSFTTYKGISEGLQLDPRAVVMDYEGLQYQRQFHAPEYHTPGQMASRLPDFRSLLYWQPGIRYTGSGVQELSFFTSDRKGRYLVVLQGINKQGQAGVTTFTFEVK